MTLIIAKDGKLHADNRVIHGNGMDNYLLGSNTIKKLVTFPFGAYAISGATTHNKMNQELFDSIVPSSIAVLTMLHWIEKNASAITFKISGKQVKDMVKVLERPDFFDNFRCLMIDNIYTMSSMCEYHVLAISSDWMVIHTPEYMDSMNHSYTLAIGSGASGAKHLLAAGASMDDVYKYANLAGLSVTSTYDTYDTATITKQPPIGDLNSLFAILGALMASFDIRPEAVKRRCDNRMPSNFSPRERNQLQYDLVSMFRFLWKHSSLRIKDNGKNYWKKSAVVDPKERRINYCLPGMYDYEKDRWTNAEQSKENKKEYEASKAKEK